jgi:hypothetical protein
VVVFDRTIRKRLPANLKQQTIVLRHSPQHRYCHFSQMEASQALLLKTDDSLDGGRARSWATALSKTPPRPPTRANAKA